MHNAFKSHCLPLLTLAHSFANDHVTFLGPTKANNLLVKKRKQNNNYVHRFAASGGKKKSMLLKRAKVIIHQQGTICNNSMFSLHTSYCYIPVGKTAYGITNDIPRLLFNESNQFYVDANH